MKCPCPEGTDPQAPVPGPWDGLALLGEVCGDHERVVGALSERDDDFLGLDVDGCIGVDDLPERGSGLGVFHAVYGSPFENTGGCLDQASGQG